MAKVKTSYTAGEKGRNRVRAFRDAKTGLYQLEWYERPLGAAEPKRTCVSMHHRDFERAKRQADTMAARIAADSPPPSDELTLKVLFDNYLREATPSKGESKRKHDARCAEMFLRAFGKDRKVTTLGQREWDRFVNQRRSGELRPNRPSTRQREAEAKKSAEQKQRAAKRHGVRDRVIAYDLKFLISVIRWAMRAQLLDKNPLAGLKLPVEENPRRPLAFQERYEAMLKVADEVDPRFGVALVLANETGHRIGSIRQLRWSDVDLKAKRIVWPAETDKLGKKHGRPLSDAALAALEVERKKHPAVGDAWLFPAPGDPTQSVSRHLVRDWWERAEKLAKLDHEPLMGWHSLRRKFATELKERPLKDVAALGGWKNPQTILLCYQREDESTMREALASRKPLRANFGS